MTGYRKAHLFFCTGAESGASAAAAKLSSAILDLTGFPRRLVFLFGSKRFARFITSLTSLIFRG
jgi:hypothetical protein